MKFVSRGDTTVVEPISRRYCAATSVGSKAELGNTRLMFMQSNGGLTDRSLPR